MSNEREMLSFSARKKRLLEEGARYRSGITHSRQVVHANLGAEVLARNAVDHLTTAALGAINNVFSVNGVRSIGLQNMVPLVISGVVALSRRSLLKPVLRGAFVVAALGSVAVLVFRRSKTKQRTMQSAK
jgi:hypothetical protein